MGRRLLAGLGVVVVALVLVLAYVLVLRPTKAIVSEPGALESAVATIRAAEGGTIALPGGSRVMFAPGALKSDQSVSVALLPVAPPQPSSGMVAFVGPVLSISFAPVSRPASVIAIVSAAELRVPQNAPAGIDLTLDLTRATADYQGTVPLLRIPTAGAGKDASIGVGLPGALDSAGKSARMNIPPDLLDNFQVPQSNAKVIAGLANWNRDLPAAAPNLYGPRLWDPLTNQWIGLDVSRLDKTKKTCVLVHGVGSTVEKAFQGSDCVRGIGSNNGCDQVVGFNYEWSQPVETSGKQLAFFLSQLRAFDDVNIEAHSLGGVVSLAALSNPETASLKVSKLVTLGSPLMGTPAADKPESLLTVLANYGALTPLVGTGAMSLKALYESSSLRDLTANNPLLAKIRTGATTTHPSMEVVPIAGTGGSLLQEVAAGLGVPTVPAAEKMLNGWLFGSQQQDMIVNGQSALGVASGLNIKSPPMTFPLTHTQLECDVNVQKEVGKRVYTAPRAEVSLVPQTLAFSMMLGDPSPAVQSLIVKNSGPPGSTLEYAISASVPGDFKWLKISGPIRPLASGDTERYEAFVDVTGLKAGTYNAAIAVSEKAKDGKSYSANATLAIVAPTPTVASIPAAAPTRPPAPPAVPPTPTPVPQVQPPAPTATTPPIVPTATAVVASNDIAGQWQGSFSYSAVGRCTAQSGQWKATLKLSGTALNVQWWDSFGNENLSANTMLNGNTAAGWTFGGGDESVQVGPLTFSGGRVQGKIVGPVCTAASGRQNGSLEGSRTGP